MNDAAPNSIASDLRVMLWRDYRIFRNFLSRLPREPMRIIGWVAWIGYISWTLTRNRAVVPMSQSAMMGALDIAMVMLLFVLSLSLIRGEHASAAFFDSPSEARWLASSVIRSWIIVGYLQFRNTFSRLPSLAIFVTYLVTITSPVMSPDWHRVIGLLSLILLTVVSRIYSLPREFAPPLLRMVFLGVGVLCGVLSFVTGLETIASALNLPLFILKSLPVMHLGQFVIDAARGDLAEFAALVALIMVAQVTVIVFCRDSYPELYEWSIAAWDFRARFREGRVHLAARSQTHQQPSSAALARIPAGPAAILWVNWLSYTRQQYRWWLILRPLVAMGAGFLLAALHIPLNRFLEAFRGVIVLTLMFSSLADASRISMDLRRPLLWLGNTPFTLRIVMLVFGWYWRSALDVSCFAFANFLGGTPFVAACSFLIIALTMLWLMRIISAAAFAMLPSRIDLAGPTILARVLFMIVLVPPPLVVGVVSKVKLHDDTLAVILGIFTALLESALLAVFTSRRLAGRYDRILGA